MCGLPLRRGGLGSWRGNGDLLGGGGERGGGSGVGGLRGAFFAGC